jgi:hypothetical protein
MEGAALSEPVWVTELLSGGPAQSTGKITLWDELLAVDGHAVIGQTLEHIVNLIWYAFQFTDSFFLEGGGIKIFTDKVQQSITTRFGIICSVLP